MGDSGQKIHIAPEDNKGASRIMRYKRRAAIVVIILGFLTLVATVLTRPSQREVAKQKREAQIRVDKEAPVQTNVLNAIEELREDTRKNLKIKPEQQLVDAPTTAPAASQTPLSDPALVLKSGPTPEEIERQKTAALIATSDLNLLHHDSRAPVAEESLEERLMREGITSPNIIAARGNDAGDLSLLRNLPTSLAAVGAPKSANDRDREFISGQQELKKPTSAQVVPLESEYVLFQGDVIPAVLQTPIQSDLLGQVTALVTSDIYDSLLKRHLLVPKGTKLVGLYSNDLRSGQERILTAFNRMILPDGRSVLLGGMSAADEIGHSGLEGETNHHFLRRFGSQFLVASLAYLIGKDDERNVTIVNNANGTATDAAGQILIDISRKTLEKDFDIPPTIVIPAGQRFNIMVNRDIVIEPQRG